MDVVAAGSVPAAGVISGEFQQQPVTVTGIGILLWFLYRLQERVANIDKALSAHIAKEGIK